MAAKLLPKNECMICVSTKVPLLNLVPKRHLIDRFRDKSQYPYMEKKYEVEGLPSTSTASTELSPEVEPFYARNRTEVRFLYRQLLKLTY